MISSASTDLMYNGSLVGKDNTNSDHTVVTKPECLYGPQVIDVIMRKPGKITIIIDLL